jgi:HEAT repeat protein
VLLVIALSGCKAKQQWPASRQSRLGGPTAKELVDWMFTSPDPDIRRQALNKLAGYDWGLKEPYAKGYADRARKDSDATVRSAALAALGRAGDRKYVLDAAACLKDAQPQVRLDAARALDNMPDDRSIEPLMGAMKDKSPEVRAAAATALRHYRSKAVLDALLAALEDADFGVRYSAADALRELTGLNCGCDEAAWQKALAGRSDPFAKSARARKPWWKLT